MKLEVEHSEFIKDTFTKMKSKEDFLTLLNYVKVLEYGEKAIPFQLKQINYHCNPTVNKNRYILFTIKKKSGAERMIHAPNRGLKSIQKCINLIFGTIYPIHPAAKGFVSGRSILDNAMVHSGSLYVYNIDLKDFFPSIDAGRIWSRLQYPPFNLSEKNGRKDLGNIITWLCCHEMEVERLDENNQWHSVRQNVLPQGAPTSPILTNIICQRLDFYLTAVANRFGSKYSRYADDITFSSMHNIYQKDGDFLKELNRIVSSENFHIKESKTRLQKKGYRQEVTGLLVNHIPNVHLRYIKQLRMNLYYWETYGYEKASNFFLQQYLKDKGLLNKGKPEMANVVGGKLEFLKMVKGVENHTFVKLKSRFDNLIKIDKGVAVETESNSLDELSERDVKEKANSIDDTNNTIGKLRININAPYLLNGQIKLNKNIIIYKGELLPLERYEENVENEQKGIDLTKHKPIDVTRFLLNFRASEGLKFLTHDYDKTDSFFEYTNILKIAKSEFDELSSQFVIPTNLWARINQFAFGDPAKIWLFDKVIYKLNWKSSELLRWIDLNPNTHPIKNENFEKAFITPFKKSIEIKAPELEYIFKNKLAENLESKFGSFDIKLIDLDKANFYTNVDALQVGISYIIKAIKQRFSNSNKIKIEFSRKTDAEGRKRIIKIVHIDSVCNKSMEKNELFQGDLLEAEKALFGICDWSILAKSPDDSVNKLNILFDINSSKSHQNRIDDSLIEGFTHELTFYS